MQWEQKTILSLVALGRITPREAERLLAVAKTGSEELWVIAACAAACFAQFLPALTRLAHTLVPRGIPDLGHAVTAITYWIGGVL